MSLENDRLSLYSEILDNPKDFFPVHRMKHKKTLTVTILGDKGSGKTLFMAIMGLFMQLLGKSFYTNFSMVDNITHKKDFNITSLYDNPNVEGIFLDEMHNIADQNSNQTVETQLLVALFTQSRKRGQVILMSSLRFYKLAKDLRFLTDVILYPCIDQKRDILHLDYWDIRNDRFYRNQIDNVSRFFKYYNTYEIIASERVKTQLASFMLKKKKMEKDIQKELDINDINLLDNLEERLKNE